MQQPTVILGRDGMGVTADGDDATESMFDAYVALVCERIDGLTGMKVDVEPRGPRDVQSNAIRADSDERETIQRALDAIWEMYCAGEVASGVIPASAIPIPDDLKALADKHGGVLVVEQGVEVDAIVWGVFFYGGASGDDIVAGGSTPTEALTRARDVMLKWEGGL